MARVDAYVVLGASASGIDVAYGALMKVLRVDSVTSAIVPSDYQYGGTNSISTLYPHIAWVFDPFEPRDVWRGLDVEHTAIFPPSGEDSTGRLFFFDLGQPEAVASWKASFADSSTPFGQGLFLGGQAPQWDGTYTYPAVSPDAIRLYTSSVRNLTSFEQLTLIDDQPGPLAEGAIEADPSRYWVVEAESSGTIWPMQIKLFL